MMPPRWVRVAVALLALAGIGVAGYLTIVHFDTNVTLACPDTGIVDCAKVTSSPQSVVFGVPVALLGLGYFCAMALLALPISWRSRSLDVWRVVLAGLGLVFVLRLVYAELVEIGSICVWCTTVHVIVLITFLILLWDFLERRGHSQLRQQPEGRRLRPPTAPR